MSFILDPLYIQEGPQLIKQPFHLEQIYADRKNFSINLPTLIKLLMTNYWSVCPSTQILTKTTSMFVNVVYILVIFVTFEMYCKYINVFNFVILISCMYVNLPPYIVTTYWRLTCIYVYAK